ncbi:MAG: hypothetical protein WA919_12200 [Coleofasciculaceae cyanobacterium]
MRLIQKFGQSLTLFPQMLSKVRPLQEDSWQDLLVPEATAKNQDVLAQVRLTPLRGCKRLMLS